VANDVTKLRNAEKALKESEELNRKMIESSYDCIILLDLEGNLKFISEGGKKLMEIDESSTMLHTPWMNLWEGSVHDSALEAISQAKQGLVGKFHGYYTTQKNTHKYWDVIISPICDNNGKVVELLSISRDVTKNKLAEEQIEKELKENKLLLSEIHHRIKNNLQIISSLLQLQQAEMKTKEGVFKGFAASQGRIQAMARAYELLLQSKYMVDVNLGEYIESLTEQIKTSYDIHNKVTISYSMDEIELGIVILDRLGLVLNEVITNAIQYAFIDRDSGNIHIELKDTGENFKIMISDDGIGIPKEFTLHDATTLSLSIIDMITQQLLGTVELVRENGTSYSFTFPKKPEVYLER